MYRQFTFTVLILIALSTVVAGQITRTTEIERALARVGDLSPESVRHRLEMMRPPAYQPSPTLIDEIIKQHGLKVMAGKDVERLKAALQPVLAYHDRAGKLSIFVVDSDQPKAFLTARAVLFITTKLMSITSHAEIRGIVAHELAHEYLWEDHYQAFMRNDAKSLREFEIFCDIVATITLKEIGNDPAHFGRGLERMTTAGILAGNATHCETQTHPSLATRLKLNEWLTRHLGQESISQSSGER